MDLAKDGKITTTDQAILPGLTPGCV